MKSRKVYAVCKTPHRPDGTVEVRQHDPDMHPQFVKNINTATVIFSTTHAHMILGVVIDE
jgi:hypothetical protein